MLRRGRYRKCYLGQWSYSASYSGAGEQGASDCFLNEGIGAVLRECICAYGRDSNLYSCHVFGYDCMSVTVSCSDMESDYDNASEV